jgi:hypothetical protein
MNQEAIQNIDPDSVQIVTVTENHEDGKLADQHRLRHANLENNVLTLEVGENPSFGYTPPEKSPLEEIDFQSVLGVKLVNHTTGVETEAQYLADLDQVDETHLHIFTDKSIDK